MTGKERRVRLSRGDSDTYGGMASSRDVSIDQLRGLCVLMVLLVHSIVAYMTLWPTQSTKFKLTSAPIIDVPRWAGFDLIAAFNDSFLMALMFLLSGVFVWPSLGRKGAAAFLRGRFIRLGIPLALVLGLLMPLAYYPSYALTGAEPDFYAYARAWLSLGAWPSGHAWFIWVLLVFDLLAAISYGLLARRTFVARRLARSTADHPLAAVGVLLVASTLAYVPLAMYFGPDRWLTYGPFSFQASRPALYALYFAAGVLIGALDMKRSIFANDAWLTRLWPIWLTAGFAIFTLRIAIIATYILPSAAAQRPAPLALRLLNETTLALCCGTFCVGFIAWSRSVSFMRTGALNSLGANAYGMYLVHYLFVVWLQFALLRVPTNGPAKAAVVFVCTVSLSWALIGALRRIPVVSRVL